MKKTYFTPEIESVKLNGTNLLIGSNETMNVYDNSGAGYGSGEISIKSNGYSGGLWDEDSYEE